MAADADTNCVKMFDVRGNFIREFGNKLKHSVGSGEDSLLDRPLGLCCDRLGNIIVCDSGHSRVVMFSNDGRFLGTLVDLMSTGGSSSHSRSVLGMFTRRTRAVLMPVDVALMASGERFAITVNESRSGLSTFRKLIVYSVNPEL